MCIRDRLGGDSQRAVQRDARIQQSGQFLREEQNVPPPAAGEGRQLQLVRFLGLHADVDGGQALFAQFSRDEFVGLAGEPPGADFAVAGYGAKEESCHNAPWGGQSCPQATLSRLDAVRVSLSPTHQVGVCGIMNEGCPIGT